MFTFLSFAEGKGRPTAVKYCRTQWTYNFEMVFLRVLYNYRQEDTRFVYRDETCLCVAHTRPYESTKCSKEVVKVHWTKKPNVWLSSMQVKEK
jgi:hypothetical protein